MSELRVHLAGTDLGAVAPELSRVSRGAPVDLRLAPTDVQDLHWLWQDPWAALYPDDSDRRRHAAAAVRRIGDVLGRVFADPAVLAGLAATEGAAEAPVLALSSDHPAILALPWELARLPDGGLLSRRVGGLARIVPEPGITSPDLVSTGPLRVLLVVNRPTAADEEADGAVTAGVVERLEGRTEPHLLRPGTLAALERALDAGRWDIVHVDAHGQGDRLILEDGPVQAERLGWMLARAAVPMLILNGCQTDGDEDAGSRPLAETLVRAGVPAVVALGADMRADSAAAFVEGLHRELAAGQAIAAACHRARREVEAGERYGPLDWAVPVLYQRPNVAPFARRSSLAGDELRLLLEPRPAQGAASGVFVGRQSELFSLDRLLDERPRVLVFGVGGVGKTTLVEHLLDWRRRTGGADRVVSFNFRAAPSLETLTGALQAEVEATLPDSVALVQSPQWTALPLATRLVRLGSAIASVSGKSSRLLFFDGIEILLGYPEPGSGPYTDEERTAFRELLRTLESPGCRVLMTSRRDEAEFLGASVSRFALTGLAPRQRMPLLMAYAETFGADHLLRHALAGDDSRGEVRQLLDFLSGHPLATRVVASGMRDRALPDLLAGIREQAALVDVPAAEGTTRSQTLEQVLAGALERLPEPRRRALGILGLFAGRFHEVHWRQLLAHPEFPPEVGVDRSEDALRDVLAHAYRLGLAAPGAESDGVWEVVPGAQAALDRLWRQSLGEGVAVRVERHFTRYWAASARVYSRALREDSHARQALYYGRVDEGNLRRALALAEREHDWTAAGSILQFLLETWPMGGRVKEADHLREEWLRKVESAADPGAAGEDARAELRAFLLAEHADRMLDMGRLDDATATYADLARSLEAAPKGVYRAGVYHRLGQVAQGRGSWAEAEAWYRRSMESSEEDGDLSGTASSYHQLGTLASEQGRLDEAEEWYRRSLAIKERLGNRSAMAATYHNLGLVAQEREMFAEALQWYRSALAINEELGNVAATSSTYHQLGILEQERGDLDAAEQWYRKALEVEQRLNEPLRMAATYHQLGQVEQDRGSLDAAERWYRMALEIDESLGRPQAANGYARLGLLELLRGNPDRAEAWIRQSLESALQRGDRRSEAAVYHQFGAVEQVRGNLDAAEQWYRKSLEIVDVLGDDRGAAQSYYNLGMVEQKRGALSRAEELYRESLRRRTEAGDEAGVLLIQHQLDALAHSREG